MGYVGRTQFYRDPEDKQKLPISENDFISVIAQNNKVADIMYLIKQIDKDRNGYVTRNELDDIIKLEYKAQLGNRNLFPIINKFSSISNKILIDYKSFKQWIIKGLADHKVQSDVKSVIALSSNRARQMNAEISKLQKKIDEHRSRESAIDNKILTMLSQHSTKS